MNKHDPLQPPSYQVPPGWERFQPPPAAEPVLQAVMVEDSPPQPVRVQPRASAWLRFWRQVGGGSLLLSIAVHVGLLLLAGLVIVGSQIAKPEVDFIPAGQRQAGIDVRCKVGIKHVNAMAKRPPHTHIVVDGGNGPSLPDAPVMDLPEAAQGPGAAGGKLSNATLGSIPSSGPGMDGPGPSANMPLMPKIFNGRCSIQNRLEKLR